MSVENKVNYLKGLAEGLQIDESTKEGKLLLAIIDVLDEIAFEMDDLDEEIVQLGDYVEELDTDLLEVEEYLYDDDDEDCGCGCGCDCDSQYSRRNCSICTNFSGYRFKEKSIFVFFFIWSGRTDWCSLRMADFDSDYE